MVPMRGVNDRELVDMAARTLEHNWNVRFIELMPMGQSADWNERYISTAEIREILSVLGPLQPEGISASSVAEEEQDSPENAGPARYFRLPGAKGTIGFISAISEHQCSECNRLRLTAAGRLRPCLFGTAEIDLKGPLRHGADDAVLARLFREAVNLKAWKPQFADPDTLQPCRQMGSIGG
jgi:cyclic pyranopterin phosphate synthase